jgi:eukaryotic-like serine/threonine-protein kinase
MTQLADQLAAALADRYAIERQIGAGGMATVYLARDLKHDRRVALKLLNPDLGAVVGAERFLSEIRVTANLQHPNLLPLFDSGSVEGLLYYVMPYVEGETLRQRLDRERQLPVDEAITIATAVAGALDYAHKHGVIHRDLKPENILLQHGQPVVADFGIALAVSNAGGERVTQTGLSLGTPQYMSPEQATGDRTIDARTDIYSLGAVTYEMLTGEPPHTGNTAQAIIARLMTEEPRPIGTVRRSVPGHVDDAVRCALEKLPADRFATAALFSQALNGGAVPHQTHHARVGTKRRLASRGLAGALVVTSVLAVLFAALWTNASRAEPQALQFVLDTPNHTVTPANESAVALSPDGGMIAYTARSAGSGVTQIFVRRLDSLSARPDPFAGIAPMFTPDGKWLLYNQAGIRRVPVNGGTPELVTSLEGGWQGYGISSRGEIVFSSQGFIWRVGEKGERIRVIGPDAAKGEASYPDPVFLDDNTIAFWLQRSDGAQGNGVGITTLKGGEHSVLNIAGNRPFRMLEGHLLIGTEEGQLLAYPMNLKRREITGPPVVLLDSAVWIITGGLQISIAEEGTLAYLRGRSRRSLALVDKRGMQIAEAPQLMVYGRAALSPDGKRVAVGVSRTTVGGRNVVRSDVWIWDVAGNSLVRFAEGAGMPQWSRDGKRIAFLQNVSARRDRVMWAAADGSGAPEFLADAPTPTSTALDLAFGAGDRELLVVVRDTADEATTDIYSLNLAAGDRKLAPLVASRFNEGQPSVSPDGRWLAYVSNESGRADLYVRPYASSAGKVRLTTNGSAAPQWLGNGRLAYSDGPRQLVAEVAQTGSAITATVKDTLRHEGTRQAVDSRGERVLVVRDPPGWRVVIVKNWLNEARRKLRAR